MPLSQNIQYENPWCGSAKWNAVIVADNAKDSDFFNPFLVGWQINMATQSNTKQVLLLQVLLCELLKTLFTF